MMNNNFHEKTHSPELAPLEDRAAIFWCERCQGPVFTPYMDHYIAFHPYFQEVTLRAENGAYLGCYEPPDPKCDICDQRNCDCWICEICGEAFEKEHEHCMVCRFRLDDCMCVEDDTPPIKNHSEEQEAGNVPEPASESPHRNNSPP